MRNTVHRFTQWVIEPFWAQKPKCENCGMRVNVEQARKLEGKPCYD